MYSEDFRDSLAANLLARSIMWKTKNRSTHIIGQIHQKAGWIGFAKMPWQCTETFLWQCTHPFDVWYCPPAVFTDHLFFEGQFNHQIMEKNSWGENQKE